VERIRIKNATRNKNARQVAEHFGITVLTVQNWRKKGCPFSTQPMPNENSTRINVLYNIKEMEKWHKKNIKQGRPKNEKS